MMELYLSVWFEKDGSFRVFRDIDIEHRNELRTVLIVRETPWPRRNGNLLWG